MHSSCFLWCRMSFQVYFRWKARFKRPKKSINCLSFIEGIWCWTSSWGAGPQVRMIWKVRCLPAFLDIMSVRWPSVGPSRKCARIERDAHGEEWRVEPQTIKIGADVLYHVVSWLTTLTLNLLTTTIVAPPSNASKWQMGFNSVFKGLIRNRS